MNIVPCLQYGWNQNIFRVLPIHPMLLTKKDIKIAGKHKIPLCTIVKPKKKLVCIRRRKWPLVYINQKRAWMDQRSSGMVKMVWRGLSTRLQKKTGRHI